MKYLYIENVNGIGRLKIILYMICCINIIVCSYSYFIENRILTIYSKIVQQNNNEIILLRIINKKQT